MGTGPAPGDRPVTVVRVDRPGGSPAPARDEPSRTSRWDRPEAPQWPRRNAPPWGPPAQRATYTVFSLTEPRWGVCTQPQ